MKKSVFLFLFLFPTLVCAQFPAPQNFQINVNYIYLGESGWCNNQLVQGPTYCYFSKVQFLDELRTGVYWVLVRENNKVLGGKMIWVGE